LVPDPACLELARKRNGFARALRSRVTEVVEDVESSDGG